jgi:ABC-type transport system involved in multi-copper enzyme maturation permease subunit
MTSDSMTATPEPTEPLAASTDPLAASIQAAGGPVEPVATAQVVPARSRPRLGRPSFAGIVAVCVKELRGRMRGRRAFIFLTFYLSVLTAFAWMIETLQERSFGNSIGVGFQGTQIGQSIFIALLLLETLLVTILAPAYTASAISLEREKQTLDLLAVTPISSLSIVLGKLVSALTFVFLLIVSSIPLTAIVFVFGGVGPDDVVRGYLVLLVTALGLGSLGLFCSALVRRTQAATIITYFCVLALTLGTAFLFFFWNSVGRDDFGIRRSQPPEALLWLNPFVSQADVICGTVGGFSGGGTCDFVGQLTGTPTVAQDGFGGAVAVPLPAPAIPGKVVGGVGVAAPDPSLVAAPAVGLRDTFWPHAAIAWIVVSIGLILLSVQLVMPTRRWHIRLGRSPRARRAA